MTDIRPITGELRDAMDVDRTYTMGGDVVSRTYYVGRDEFVNLCDAIDSIHANLERENASLKAELDRLMGEQEEHAHTMGESITSELRKVAAKTECANGRCEKLYRGDIDHIADRIDAEHERIVREMGEEIVRDVRREWVRLPVDAEGEPINIGDVMEWPDNGETFEVVGIGDGWTLFYVIEDGVAEWTRAENKRHHQLDTWERIIRDALGARWTAPDELSLDYDALPTFDALVARCRALAGDAS